MRYMGIDYGSKRVGIALSDATNNTFALPYKVIPNTKKLLDEVNEIICKENITHIILGESKDFHGEDNKIMGDIKKFKEAIENNLGKIVILEPEFLTSHQAEHIQGKNDMLDASAAALILKSYLDRIAHTTTET